MLVITGPRAPVSIETMQLTAFAMAAGTTNGPTERQPLATISSVANSISVMPPPPVAISTPTLSRLLWSMTNSASASACLATAMANWDALDMRRATLRVEVYRPAGASTVPTAADVIARARASVAEIDLGDERSVAAVRDTVARARPCRSPTWLDRLLGWLPGR